MRAVIVVVLLPYFNLLTGVVKRQESALVKALLPHPTIERLDEGVVRRFARPQLPSTSAFEREITLSTTFTTVPRMQFGRVNGTRAGAHPSFEMQGQR